MGGVAEEKPAGGMGQMQAGCPPGVLNQDISDAPWYGVQVGLTSPVVSLFAAGACC
jgi:hypothetical protein